MTVLKPVTWIDNPTTYKYKNFQSNSTLTHFREQRTGEQGREILPYVGPEPVEIIKKTSKFLGITL